MDDRALVWTLGSRRVDLTTGMVEHPGGSLRLTEQERQLLLRLAVCPGVPVSRDALLTDVWGYRAGVASRAPDVAIRRVRQKLEADPSQPVFLRTVHRKGWALSETVPAVPAVRSVPRPLAPHFVGRATELAALDAAWKASARVVVLVGPPGVGKTTLARRALSGWAGARVEVPLVRVTDEMGLLTSIAEAAAVPVDDLRSREEVAERVARALQARRAWVWLDPADVVAQSLSRWLTTWATSAPAVRFVVCSQRRLEVADARTIVVEPLPIAEAEELFLARATAHGWHAEADTRAFVEALEGLPLTIELAASRVRVLGLDGLLGAHGLRHERLTGAVTLSRVLSDAWQRLDGAQQAVLGAASLLSSPASLAVLQGMLPMVEVSEVLPELETRSLLEVVGRGPRYRLLDAVRWHAARSWEGREAVTRLVAWVLARTDDAYVRSALRHRSSLDMESRRALCLHAERVLPGATLSERWAWLEEAIGEVVGEADLAAARVMWELGEPGVVARLDHIVAEGSPAVADAARVQLALVLRGDEREGPDLSEVLPRLTNPTVRVEALRTMARLYADAARWIEAREALARAEVVAEHAELASAWERVLLDRARVEVDTMQAEAGLRVLARLPERSRGRPEVAQQRGALLLQQGAFEAAAQTFDACVVAQRAAGLRRPMAVTLGNLGIALAELGELPRSIETIRQAVALHLELGAHRSVVINRVNLSNIALLQGDLAVADHHLEAARRSAEQRGWPALVVMSTYVSGLSRALAQEDHASEQCFRRAFEGAAAVGLGWIARMSAAHLGAMLQGRDSAAWWARSEAWVEATPVPGAEEAVAVLRGDAEGDVTTGPAEVRIATTLRALRASPGATAREG